MFESIEIILAAGLGAVLAVFYFGGLWWTLQCLSDSQRPLAIYFASLTTRMVIALLVFSGLAVYGAWQAFATCLLGFLITRIALVRFLGREPVLATVVQRSGP
ncbi:ATP synthase subunit I [Stieleria sp. ICT_E10.1]|uniref:ATP synthase subunit I n=1 Tax=Stieleria sedimenti TaxID=2976331 RepID=UPI00217F6051|nr:ATP synthase subunit I [Stieleria sedimenti]MCS7465685.1 ATP synthase subunit I [Stieleria sedimenti]